MKNKKSMQIKILSETTINRIAAGEVVERPSSVVKELVENSIDAKATQIDIVIENAGKNLISISDNGCGMSREDLELSVERHATSKLLEDDIHNIQHFGFRGEALPSIASVSKMKISSISNKDQSDFAWSIQINGGQKQETSPSPLSYGTKIEVRDLFFATPARLKFLKSDKNEANSIVEIINKIAIANPSIGFKLTADGKEILNLKANNNEEPLYYRLKEIIGEAFDQNFTQINFKEEDIRVYGFIGAPTHNVGTSNEQHIFINKRPIRDKLISMAIKIAYQDFIPSGRFPIVYLFLDLEPSMVDVNVHPTKAEVRFKDPNMIRNSIISALRNGIKQIGQNSSLNITQAALNSFKAENIEELEKPNNHPDNRFETIFNRNTSSTSTYTPPHSKNFPQKPSSVAITSNQRFLAPVEPASPKIKSESAEFSFDEIDFPLGSACAQIHETYIISQTRDGFILIDQHAAHERIFYESLKRQILSKNIPTQRLFIPEIIEVKEHKLEQLIELQDEFKKMGLHFTKFGNNEISISELPALLKCIDVKKLILDIIDDLEEYGIGVSLEKKINHYLATFACHHSIRSGRALSIKEMNSLLREMENCEHSGQCNHGRPTFIKLNLKDIEKLFERS